MKTLFSNIRIFISAASFMLLAAMGIQSHNAQAEVARVQSYNYPTMYWRHSNFDARIEDNVSPEKDSEWQIVSGLASSGEDYVSFQSVNFPGYYLRHSDFDLALEKNDGSSKFAADSTFKKVKGLKDATWTSFQSYNYPTRYIRHSAFFLKIDPISTDLEKKDATFKVISDDCVGIGASNADIIALQTCSGNPSVCNVGGNDGTIYNVKIKFNDAYTAPIEVFGESRRRLFFENTPAGKCVNALVDVRDYIYEGEPQQARDPGTPGLNLRVQQGSGHLTALSVTPAINPVVMFIAGDSTVADQPPQWDLAANQRYTGWGGMIPKFFGNKIAVANYADSGESTAAFRTDGGFIWAKINARLKANDWVLIQLGHNDKTTPAATYRSRILGMITAIKAKGAKPVLITPMIRNTGDPLASQHIYGDLNVRNELLALASSQNVPLVDLMQISSVWSQGLGVGVTQTYFVGTDKTHSNEIGAELFAQMIADDIRRQKLSLASFLH